MHEITLNKTLNGGCSGDSLQPWDPLDCVRIEDKLLLLVGIGSRGKTNFKDEWGMETGESRLLVLCLLGYFYWFHKEYYLGRGGFCKPYWFWWGITTQKLIVKNYSPWTLIVVGNGLQTEITQKLIGEKYSWSKSSRQKTHLNWLNMIKLSLNFIKICKPSRKS